ncbi:MAG: hypothetical protein NTY01_05610, partial [Verrucomicrobia bacterium]|nr:hypothetical protein [Verrucomicrobiota bacterium]
MKDHLDSHHLTGDRPPKTRRPVFRMLSAVAALLAASAALGASNTYSTIQFRRGPEVQRTGVVFAVGEPAFTTNNHKLYIGDGVTLGGVGV